MDELSEETPTDTQEPDSTPKTYSNTIAILRIPSIELAAPVGFGVKDADLKKQVGMYTTTDKFVTSGGNTGIAGHTSFRGGCSYCFFYRLREVVTGENIFIDYNDGKTYTFKVIEIMNDMPITADIPYKYKKEGSALVTLSTCSTLGKTRDFVVAELIDITQTQR